MHYARPSASRLALAWKQPRGNDAATRRAPGHRIRPTEVPMLTADPQVADLIAAEERRQAEHLVLIPSENYASAAVRAANGSVLTDKYSEGYADRRYYEGNAIVDRIELLAVERARALFGVDYANV